MQIVGPILFKLALRRVGEAGKDTGKNSLHVDEDEILPTAMVLGDTPNAIAQAVRLLNERWRVVLLAPHDAAAPSSSSMVARALATGVSGVALRRTSTIGTGSS